MSDLVTFHIHFTYIFALVEKDICTPLERHFDLYYELSMKTILQFLLFLVSNKKILSFFSHVHYKERSTTRNESVSPCYGGCVPISPCAKSYARVREQTWF